MTLNRYDKFAFIPTRCDKCGRYKQGMMHKNPFEVHIQDDLIPELFDIRYPGFKPIYMTDLYAYYVKKDNT